MTREPLEVSFERVRRELVRMRRQLSVLALALISSALLFMVVILKLHPA